MANFAKQMELITEISEHVDKIRTYVNDMIEARKNANQIMRRKKRPLPIARRFFLILTKSATILIT